MPKLRHFDNLGTVRFVTFSSYRRQKCLLARGMPELIIRQVKEVMAKWGIRFFGYVIMPEHVPFVLLPPEGLKLGPVIGEIKSKMAREYFAHTPGIPEGSRVFWQKRCFDHNCRTPETVKEKIEYCHNNPVRRKLVAEPGEYRWSSYNWYMGKEDVPFAMDEYEL